MKERPSAEEWLRQARTGPDAAEMGMLLIHNGVVRKSPKAAVRYGEKDLGPVRAVRFSSDEEKLAVAIEETRQMEGIFCVRVWLNEGEIPCGGDLMQVLVGGDIRPHVLDALTFLVGKIKRECVREEELF